jgi:Aldehyde dehydrogenase family
VDVSFDRSWLHDPDLFREDLFVGGRWRSGGTGRRIEVTDPATGDVIGRIAEADETDVRDAIAAAQEAFGVWAGCTAQERARILRRWHDLIGHAPAWHASARRVRRPTSAGYTINRHAEAGREPQPSEEGVAGQ